MLVLILGSKMWARIVAASGLRAGDCANALEVITGEFEQEWEAANWVYDLGAREVGKRCRESFDDAHQVA